MSDNRDIYSDGIGNIHMVGGMVKMDLVSLEPALNEKDSPVPKITERVVMSPDGFLKSFTLMQKLVAQLEEKGLIKKQPIENSGAVEK